MVEGKEKNKIHKMQVEEVKQKFQIESLKLEEFEMMFIIGFKSKQ